MHIKEKRKLKINDLGNQLEKLEKNIIGLKKEGNKRLKVENEIEDNDIIKEPIKQKVDFFENTDKIAKL